MRNDLICFAIQQRVNQGESPAQAQKLIAERLYMSPDTIRRKIWDNRNKAGTEEIAKLNPDADFLDIL